MIDCDELIERKGLGGVEYKGGEGRKDKKERKTRVSKLFVDCASLCWCIRV